MSKVKVTKEQMEAFNRVSDTAYWTPKRLITDTAERRNDWGDNVQALNDIDLKTMSALVFFPELIEVYETPEEKLLKIYREETPDKKFNEYFNQGIEYALNTLNIQIKGINA